MSALVTLIILVALIGLGAFLSNKWWDSMFGGIIVIIAMGMLIIHLSAICTVSSSYNRFVVERSAFEQTLKVAREGGNEYEAAAIVKDVAKWNIILATRKYENNTFFFDQYVDDRFDNLSPIN